MQDQIEQIRDEYLSKISEAKNLKELDKIYLELFGKTGKITLLPRDFSNLPKDELKNIGPLFNKTKNELDSAIAKRRDDVRESSYNDLEKEGFDLTKEVKIKEREGYLHPLTEFEDEIVNIFSELGFQRFDAPHIDTDYYNFEALNIPEEHPARDLWDTLYIAEPAKYGYKPGQLLLRTHTSNAQLRVIKELGAPSRIMIIDRCFRYENLDARHEHTFDQFELVYIDKGLSMANLQYLSEYLFKKILGEDTQVRMRPKYYPFVEPTAGIDALCPFCKGKGCRVCGEGWIELAGAGMVHPQVIKNGGLDPAVYSGIAWGLGPERVLIAKNNIADIRQFKNGDLRFIQSFNKSS